MSFKNLAGDFADRLGPALQFVENRRWKAACNSEFAEFRPQKVLAAHPSGEGHALLDFPESIGLQVEEGKLGVRGFSRRPKLLQQPFERLLQLIERDQPFRAGLNLSQRIQHKKRLVRRALITAAPDVQIAELLDQSIYFRQWLTD